MRFVQKLNFLSENGVFWCILEHLLGVTVPTAEGPHASLSQRRTDIFCVKTKCFGEC